MRVFRAERKRIPKTKDSLAERTEFELPVPISKLSDDSIMLEFATARRTALIARNYNTVGATGRSQETFRPARHARYPPAR
jgi:hypothetical protein